MVVNTKLICNMRSQTLTKPITKHNKAYKLKPDYVNVFIVQEVLLEEKQRPNKM